MTEAAVKVPVESNGLPEPVKGDPNSDGSSSALFQRRIEFHLARKPFNGFNNGNINNNSGFKLETLNPSSSLRNLSNSETPKASSGSGKKQADLAECNGGLDPELSFTITFRRIGAGLQNLGNTCFLNSVLQCLTYTEPLAAYLQSGKHQSSCRTAGFCALCAIQRHVSRALQSTGRTLAPKDLVSNLRCISRSFRNARQEDAHEYMVNLLESMHKCCLPSGVPSESPSAYEKSLVHKIFGGRLRSQVKCMQCSFCSNKFDPFLDLSLEIIKADSLHKALAHFTAKEHLDGGERQYHCQQCKQKVRALKQLTIYNAPQVLTIHLKRFGSHIGGQKIDKKIQFSPTLDLKPFVTGPYDGDLKYTLYGVLVHAGWSTHSGHYYCFVRTSSGMWYSLDDNRVVQVSEKMVLEQKAYLLFYVRDRKPYAPKKPVDFIPKENMVVSSTASKANFNQGSKESAQNGFTDKKCNGPIPASVVQKCTWNAGPSKKDDLMKESSSQKDDSLPIKECSSLNMDPPESLPRMLTRKASDKSSSIPNVKGESLSKTGLPMKAANGTPNLDNMITTTATNAVNNIDSGIQKDFCASVATQTSCNVKQRMIKNEISSSICNSSKSTKHTEKHYLTNGVKTEPVSDILDNSSGAVFNMEKSISEKNDNESSSLEFSPGKSKSVGNGNLRTEKNSKPGQEASTSNTNSSKALDKPRLSVKRKAFKCHVASMRLSSNIIASAALGLRKKKHKQKKRPTLENGKFGPGHLLEGASVFSDRGPSTSKMSEAPSIHGSIHSSRKRSTDNCDFHSVGRSNDLLKSVSAKEVQERFGQNGTVLSNDKEPHQISSASIGNCYDAKESNVSKDAMQSLPLSKLTGDLMESTVPCWDGVESLSTEITEFKGAEGVTIGYVADEWDEEYDRGKRKKLRNSKIDFSGPNLFQEIAAKKAKAKKAKLHHSSAGNLPFRI